VECSSFWKFDWMRQPYSAGSKSTNVIGCHQLRKFNFKVPKLCEARCRKAFFELEGANRPCRQRQLPDDRDLRNVVGFTGLSSVKSGTDGDVFIGTQRIFFSFFRDLNASTTSE
jgi:hypothetical protein